MPDQTEFAAGQIIAGGIDLGGSKIEAQVFGTDWAVLARRRVETPTTYEALLAAVVALIGWIDAAGAVPVGIAAAGLVHPVTGLVMAANLPVKGRPFPADIRAAVGRGVTYINDVHGFTLSEAVFGAARGQSPAVGLMIGTGVGGGVAVEGRLATGALGLGGEFGHFALAAAPVLAHGLPVIRCGCGRMGCTETLISGPGLARIVRHKTGREMTPAQIGLARKTDTNIAGCWDIWCELVAETLFTLCLTLDPACIVLGGGVAQIDGVAGDLTAALQRAQLAGFPVPVVRLAEAGDASVARGAAYAALTGAGA